MKKVLVTGTFDIIHPGHLWLLRQAKKRGDFLTVVVARDATVQKIKGQRPKYHEKQRLINLKKLNIADRIVMGYTGDKLRIIRRLKPDIICLGYDQKIFTANLKQKLKNRELNIKVARLKAFKPHLYKSSLLRKKLD
jgi:FAD synthetase